MKDENNPPQPWIDPALEARIVASVLGETSAFEAAELERLVAANPELALFKRRIEATHDLLETATRPENPKIQLSPERRRKLLETIGVPAVAPPKKIHAMAPPSPWWTSPLFIRAAACLIMTGLAVALLSSITVSGVRRETADFEGGDTGSVSVQVPLASTAPQPLSQLQPPSLGDIPLAGRTFRESVEGASSSQFSAPSAVAAAPAPASAAVPSSGFIVFRKGGEGTTYPKDQAGKNRELTTQKLNELSTFTGGAIVAAENVDEAMKLSSGIADLARAQQPVMQEELQQLQEALPMEQAATGREALARAEMAFKSAENVDADDSARGGAFLASDRDQKARARSQDRLAAQQAPPPARPAPAGTPSASSDKKIILTPGSIATSGLATATQPLDSAQESLGVAQAPQQANQQAYVRLSKRAEAVAVGQVDDIVSWNSGGIASPEQVATFEKKQAERLATPMEPTEEALKNSVVQLAQQLASDPEHQGLAKAEGVAQGAAEELAEAKAELAEAKPQAVGDSQYRYRGGEVAGKDQREEASKLEVEKDYASAVGDRLTPKAVADLQRERKSLEMNAKTTAEGSMLAGARNGVAPEEWQKQRQTKRDMELQPTLTRIAEIQAQLKANPPEAVAIAAADEMENTAAAEASPELLTQLQEKETLIEKLRFEVEASKALANKQKKVAPRNEGAAASATQAELMTQLQDSETIIAKLQSELEATDSPKKFMKEAAVMDDMATATAAKEVPHHAAVSANSIDALVAGVAGSSSSFEGVSQPVFGDRNGRVEFDGFVNYGSPIAKSATSETGGRLSQTTPVQTRWNLPLRRLDVGTTTIIAQPEIDQRGGTSVINRKLDEIVIPRINFEDVTVQEALDIIKQRAVALDYNETDPTKKGVNIVLNLPPDVAESEAKITLGLTDIPLRAAINYVTSAANLKLKVEPNAVSVVPLSTATGTLVTKEYKVPPGFITDPPQSSTPAKLGAGALTAAGSLSSISARSGAREYLESLGVSFPSGATAYYLPNQNKLFVKNTLENLDIIDFTVDASVASTKSLPLGNEISTSDERFSTFSLHVSDVSFQLAKDALARGAMPDPSRIRPEEFYNAFDYNDPAPGAGEEVACRIEQSAHPLLQQRDLVRIAVKVAAAGRAAGQPLRLTILLDTSGSMEREDRAASVRRALQSLVGLLGPNDRITLIGFARTPRLLAEDVPGDQAGKLVEMADRTPSQGGTNLEEALALASELALKHRVPNGQNRIVLLTDGAANLGDANPERLARQIDKTRQQGISFDACGVGAKGLNDEILEALTRKGDGRYYFLNKPEDADEGFARQLAGAFRPAAENVKVQVVFNPSRVASYRLIGFEKHLLEKQDFRNDKVQAAELSAEEAGVALYQIQPLPEGSGELGEVFVRFRDPATGKMVERSWTMPYDERTPSFDQASPSLQLAATSALLAERLAGNEQIDLNALAPVLNRLRARYGEQERVGQLLQMFERVRR